MFRLYRQATMKINAYRQHFERPDYTGFISTGQKDFNLDADTILELVLNYDLNQFNPRGCRIIGFAIRTSIPVSVKFLIFNPWIPRCLNLDDVILRMEIGGTNQCFRNLHECSQFQGQGEKYLGFRFLTGSDFKYGWIKIIAASIMITFEFLSTPIMISK
jgi:hypothetical protein